MFSEPVPEVAEYQSYEGRVPRTVNNDFFRVCYILVTSSILAASCDPMVFGIRQSNVQALPTLRLLYLRILNSDIQRIGRHEPEGRID
jgi:hypothetical protein